LQFLLRGDYNLNRLGHLVLTETPMSLPLFRSERLAALFLAIVCVIGCYKTPENEQVLSPAPETDEEVSALFTEDEFTNSIGMKFTRIPAGTFWMGAPEDDKDAQFIGNETPRHEVTIKDDFFIGVHEVTQKQFKTVMGYNPSYFSHDGKPRPGSKLSLVDYSREGKPGKGVNYASRCPPAGGKDRVKGIPAERVENFPVENISWAEVLEFLQKLNALESANRRVYRLPNEAEWEYACQGSSHEYRKYHFGNEITPKLANFREHLRRTCEVGSYPPNEFGIYDMHGNVHEMCVGWRDGEFTIELDQPDHAGWIGPEMIRGGSHYDFPQHCRASIRCRYHHHDRCYTMGFRVVLVPVR
jgi:formylglycine-generating enzyme required for sulfatase activity